VCKLIPAAAGTNRNLLAAGVERGKCLLSISTPMSDSTDPNAPIVCHASGWYLWKRVVPMSIVPLLMSAYFFYDYKVGYPAKLEIYEEFQRYKKEGRSEEWVRYSADQGWPKEPDLMDQRKIDEQFHWGVGVGILGIWCLGYYLLSYPKKLKSDATSFTPPWSGPIPFSSVVKLDKRPWKLKGLAKVFYQKGSKVKTVMIDDLRFPGAEKVLARLEHHFTGEIIDNAEEPPATPTEETPPAASV
jgi:hypothetical protein